MFFQLLLIMTLSSCMYFEPPVFALLPLHSRDNTVETFCSSLKSSLKTENDGLAHTNITSVVNLLKSCSFEPWRQTKRKQLPPLRFPLREALLSLHDSVNEPPSVRTAVADSASLATLGPYKVSSTEKSRALKKDPWCAQNIELHARLKKWSHIRKLKIRFRTPFENKWKDCKAEPALAANPGFKWLDCDSYWLVGSCREVSFHSLFLQESAAGPQNIFLASH